MQNIDLFYKSNTIYFSIILRMDKWPYLPAAYPLYIDVVKCSVLLRLVNYSRLQYRTHLFPLHLRENVFATFS